MREIKIITPHLFQWSSSGPYVISGGGLERYTWDLCETLQELGMKVSVHQLTYNGSFHKQVGHIDVVGHQVGEEGVEYQLVQISEEVTVAGGFIIYAGIEKFGHSFPYHSGSIGIYYSVPSDRGKEGELSRVKDDNVNSSSTYNRFQQVIAVNSFALGWIHAAYHGNEQKQGIVIRQAVDTAKFKPTLHWSEPKRPLRIVFPRVLDQGREVVNTLLMIDHILQVYPEVQIEFANDSEQDNEFSYAFRLWLRDHPHKDRIFNEKYTFRKMVDAYRKANMVVIPSFFKEGSIYSCLEAMNCGVPVIVGNRGGVCDVIVDGYNGLVVEPLEGALFKGISRLLDHSDVRRYLGFNARRTASAFGKKLWRCQWTTLMQNLSDAHISTEEKRPDE